MIQQIFKEKKNYNSYRSVRITIFKTCNFEIYHVYMDVNSQVGGGPRVVVSTAAIQFISRSRRFERNKNVSSPSTRETQYCGEPP